MANASVQGPNSTNEPVAVNSQENFYSAANISPACRAGALTTELIARPNPCLADVRVGEPIGEYHGDKEYLSTSSLRDYGEGLAYYCARHVYKTVQAPESDALSHGSKLHRWLEDLDDSLPWLAEVPASKCTATGGLGQTAQKWAKEHLPEESRQFLASPAEMAQLRREIAALREAYGSLLDSIVIGEVSLRWEQQLGDGRAAKMRCRPDAVTYDRLVDLKTTREKDPSRRFWKSILDYGYDLQDWVYQRGMEAYGMEPQPLLFLVVSTTTYACQCGTIPQQLTRTAGVRALEALTDLTTRRELDWWHHDDHGDVVEFFVPESILGRTAQ
jgi:hypothetical protein